jgi:uncharacterized protein YxjI
MKLLIKQRVFSWTDSYDVYDEWGEPVFFVQAKFLSLGHQIFVYDRAGNEVGSIHQRLLHLLPTFEIVLHGQELGQVYRQFSLFRPRYTVECADWNVEGDLMGWDYDVFHGSSLAAHISKELFRWGDTYVLDIANLQDAELALLLVIAIDAANCSE